MTSLPDNAVTLFKGEKLGFFIILRRAKDGGWWSTSSYGKKIYTLCLFRLISTDGTKAWVAIGGTYKLLFRKL